MSLLPYILEEMVPFRPSRLPDQHFGIGLLPQDLLEPSTIHTQGRPYNPLSYGYYRPWRTSASVEDSGSTISMGNDKFQVSLDVQQFSPNEISVQISGDNMIRVEGKHEERQDEHGFVSRHFVRRYLVPKGHNIQQVVSNLSSDGILTITAPKVSIEGSESRNIPIIQTGVPSKSVGKQDKQQDCGDKKNIP